MIIADETNLYDLLLTTNAIIINYIDFLKSINKKDMNENVVNQNIILNYNKNNEVVYNFFLEKRNFQTGIFLNDYKINIIDPNSKAFNNGFDDGFN